MHNRLISRKRSVIPSADVRSLDQLQQLCCAVKGIQGIEAIKIGMALMPKLGSAVAIIREELGEKFRIIFDYQKAGNDIPEMGPSTFSKILKDARVNAAILFPFAGPVVQRAWTAACQDASITVLTGGIMTHEKFLASEGGYITDDAPERIFRLAVELGVRHFVVPGTKIEWVIRLRALLVELLGEGNFTLYAPGFISQGGVISECGEAAGENWHAIIGSGIYKENTLELQRRAAIEYCSQIAA